ncbi:MBG domain-containing protein, partial [Amaricoccus sp.]|uniref:two-partner secretion domain-containing protein n=1 Tax=Amaricoccus sp. TaxID=1872485 RepID=UPI001B667A86
MALAGGPGRAGTLPSGGKVAAGKATIAKAGPGRMQIRQRSKSAIVNWKGFSIGRGDRVDIDQPSRKAAILNRVTGSTKSSIRGQLSANGKVYLVNPNGVEITRTGRVKAHAFVGSTLDISDRDFRKGKGRFASADAAPAAVRNAGVIEAKSYAALLGGKVENSGTISAELGSVGLGAGRRATLKLSGNFLQVALPPDGDGPLIDSSGTLRGGRVELRAAAAREAARQAVNLSGVVEARSVAKRGGAIVIGGGAGEVAISGRLDASAAHGKGGSVEVTGDRLRLAGATIDASGAAGGGEINLGGGLRGEGPLPRARLTEADAASVISADATRSGDGGSVVVWSDGFTGFAGRITARGGPKGGDGGFAEVSGKRLLSFTGTADLRGARFGTLLLDPSNIVISDDATAGIDVALDGTWFISPDADSANSILNATGLETLLGAANVNVTTENIQFDEAGNITVVAPLAWDTATTLFLDADGAIDFQNTITAPLGTLNAATAGLGAITTTDGAVIEVSSLNFTAQAVAIGGQITTQSGSILSRSDISITGAGVDVGDTLDFNAAASVLLDAPLDGGSVSITAGGGDIDTTAAGAITVDELTLSAGDGIDALGSVAVDGLFLLQSGDWTQNANPLPAFEAGDFQVVEGSATFLRVLGGNGDNIAFQLGDIYGVQGVSGFPNQNFALNNDIDASGTSGWNYYGSNGDSGFAGFEPVLGVDVSGAPIPFTGTFDGGGLTIDGLTITRGDEDQVGLFAALGAGAEVTDLALTNASVFGGYNVGILAGGIDAGASVTGVSVAGTVSSEGGYGYDATVGGLAGANAGSILDSTSSASVDASAYSGEGSGEAIAGGLVGFNQGTITGSSTSGTVTADGGGYYGYATAGGLAGVSTGSILGSTSSSSVDADAFGGSGEAIAGGLVGDSQSTITGSSATGTVAADGGYYGYATAGGLAGVSAASILDSTSSASVTASALGFGDGAGVVAGGLVGDNQSTITGSSATGTVAADGEGGLVLVGGLAGISSDAISGSTAAGAVTATVSGGSIMAGGLVGQTVDVGESAGTIDGSSATGAVQGTSDAGGAVWVGGLVGGSSAAIATSFATGAVSGTLSETGDAESVLAAGGLVGVNISDITDSFATGAVTATGDGDGVGPAVSISAGGLVGGADGGAIERAFANGDVVAQGDDLDASAGGLVGQNSGSVADAFASGDVTSAGGSVGGLVGDNVAAIARTYAIGAVSDGGDGAGGLVGLNNGTVDSSFWDVTTSGTGFSDGGDGLTTAEFQDTAGFFALADAAEWNFEEVWAPSSLGFYPEIYTINPVVRVDPNDADRQYGLANPPFTVAQSFGGPGVYVFGPDGDTAPDYAGTLTSDADATSPIGDYDILASGTVISPLGQAYRVTTLDPGTLAVTPAPLTIAVGDDSKVYGEVYDLGDVGFTVTGLLNDDTVDTVTFASLGAPATAPVGDYDIDVVSVDGQGIGNYVLFPDPPDPGTLAVTPAPLTIAVGDDSKVYGEVYDLGDVDFTVTGLRNNDTVDSVTFASLGAPATAPVGDYDIDVVSIDGQGLGNYVLLPDPPDPGTLTVTPAPLTIAVGDDSKVYGEVYDLGDVGFTVTGLLNDDTVDTVTFAS